MHGWLVGVMETFPPEIVTKNVGGDGMDTPSPIFKKSRIGVMLARLLPLGDLSLRLDDGDAQSVGVKHRVH